MVLDGACQSAVDDLVADFYRQGQRLEVDQVNRLLSRRGISEATITVHGRGKGYLEAPGPRRQHADMEAVITG